MDHHFRGLDDHGNAVAGFEVHFLGAAPGDYTFDFILANLNNDMRHHGAEFYIRDLTTKLIACG